MAFKKCVLCDGELKPKIIDKKFTVNNQTLLIPNVPVIECSQCKEQYFNPEASRYIDEQVEKFRAGEMESELEVKIKEIRAGKGLTQQEVAKKLGFSVARFSEIERNKRVPNVLLALKLANVLDCSINDLYKLRPFMRIGHLPYDVNNYQDSENISPDLEKV